MSNSARVLLAVCAMLLAATVTAAAVFSSDGRVDVSTPDAGPSAPMPVFVSPAPVAYDLEPDSPADL